MAGNESYQDFLLACYLWTTIERVTPPHLEWLAVRFDGLTKTISYIYIYIFNVGEPLHCGDWTWVSKYRSRSFYLLRCILARQTLYNRIVYDCPIARQLSAHSSQQVEQYNKKKKLKKIRNKIKNQKDQIIKTLW